jgi:transmembrane sensor
VTTAFNNRGNGRRPTAIAREAAEWLVALSDTECTREQREQFITWLRRSNLHVEEFLRISELTGTLAHYPFWPDDSVADLIASARAAEREGVARRIGTSIHPAIAPSKSSNSFARRRWRASVVLAASLMIVVLTVGVMTGMFDWSSKTYVTNAGEMRSIALEDGSVVELNTRSRLRARFTANERRLQLLAGEAIFNVARNPRRPFRVFAGSTEIVAVGTQFNVDAHDSRTVVTVLEGRVRVTNNADLPPQGARPIELSRGEQAVIARHQPPKRISMADTARATAWTERRLFFEGATLADIAAEFARYNDKSIRINGQGLASRRITGVFNATDQATFVEFLRTHSDVRVREDERGWVLEAGASEQGTDGGER